MRLDIERISGNNLPNDTYIILMGNYGDEAPKCARMIYYGYVDNNGVFYYGSIRFIAQTSKVKESLVLDKFYYSDLERNSNISQEVLKGCDMSFLVYKITEQTINYFNDVQTRSDAIKLLSLLQDEIKVKVLPPNIEF